MPYAAQDGLALATYDTAGTGISPASSGNRASTSKNFSNSANPNRFAPDLFRSRSWSSSSSVQTSIRSSGSYSCRTPVSLRSS